MKFFENRKKQHFGFRKLSVGLASVLLSTTIFYMENATQVKADDQTVANASNSQQDDQTTPTDQQTTASADLSNSTVLNNTLVLASSEPDADLNTGIINVDNYAQEIKNDSPRKNSDGSYNLYSSAHEYTTTAYGNQTALNKPYSGYEVVQGNVYIRDISDEYVKAGGSLARNERRWEIDYGRSKTAQQGQGSYWASIMLSKGMSIKGNINITMMSSLDPNNIQASSSDTLQINPTTGPTLGPDGRDIKYDNISSGTNSVGAKVFMADRTKYKPNGTANLTYNGYRFNSSNDARLEIWLSPNFSNMSQADIAKYLTGKISTQQGYTKNYNSNRDANVFLFNSSNANQAANIEFYKDGTYRMGKNAFDLWTDTSDSNPNAAGNLGKAYAFHYAAAGGSNADRIMTTMQFTTFSDGSATPHFVRAGFTADDAQAYYVSSANLSTLTNYKVIVNESSNLENGLIPARTMKLNTPDNDAETESFDQTNVGNSTLTNTFNYNSDTDNLLGQNQYFKLTLTPTGDSTDYKYTVSTPVIDEANHTITYNVEYTANQPTINVVAIDQDNQNSALTIPTDFTTTFNGDIDTAVPSDLTDNITKIKQYFEQLGYTFNSSASTAIPTKFGSSANDNQTISLVFNHDQATVTPDDEVPAGANFTKANYDKTVTRTIVDADNPSEPLVTQAVRFGRTISYDKITGKIVETSSQDWKNLTDNNNQDTGTWSEYLPAKPNYSVVSVNDDPNQKTVEAVTITHATTDQTVSVKFARNDQTVTVQIIDQNTGILLTTIPVSGKPGEQKAVPNLTEIINGYTENGYVVSDNPIPDGVVNIGENDSNVTIVLEHGTGVLNPGEDVPVAVNNSGTVPQFSKADYDKTVTRTIIDVDNPTNPLATQSVNFGRTITYDTVTGQIDESKSGLWNPTNGTWDAYTPVKDNYSVVSIDNNPDKRTVDAENVDLTSTDKTVSVKFERNPQTVTVKVVDKDDNDKVLTEIPVQAKPGEEVSVPDLDETIKSYTDKGYTVVTNQTNNGKVTGQENDSEVTITLEHGTATVNPGDEVPTGADFTKDDYEKTVTRKIVDNTDPSNPQTLTEQKVDFGRTVTYDKVTGKMIEEKSSPWTPETGTWEAYTPTKDRSTLISIDGDPNKKTIDSKTVTRQTPSETLNVTFERNPQTVTVKVVDKDDNDKVLTEIPVQAKPGEEVSVPGLDETIKSYTDKGYTVVTNQTNNGKVTGQENDSEVTITLEHGTATVKPGEEVPTGVNFTKDDYEKTVTRKIVDNNDPSNPQTLTEQKMDFGRTVTYDKVTGKIIEEKSSPWTPETGTWEAYTPNTKPGYHITFENGQDTVPAKTVTIDTPSETIDVTYRENDGKITVITQDRDGHESSVDLPSDLTEVTVPAGQADKVIETTLNKIKEYLKEKGYNFDESNQVPTPDGRSITILVKVSHDKSQTTEEKVITRTIKVTDPDKTQHVITQKVTYHRVVEFDKVTGQTNYGAWTTSDKWDRYVVPAINNYSPTPAVIEEVVPSVDENDQTVSVGYTWEEVAVDKNKGNGSSVKQGQTNSSGDAQSKQIGSKTGHDADQVASQNPVITAKKLPQTGESNNAILGLILSAFSLGLFALKKKEDE